MFLRLPLTNNQTVFEYDDSLDEDKLPYHPGYIKISEVDLFQQYRNAPLRINTHRIMSILVSLYAAINNGHYSWINTIPPQYNGILGVIMSRLACITNEYNHYQDFIEYLQDTTDAPVQLANAYLHDPRFIDDEEYQLRLSQFILNTFINTFGVNDTATLFAKHYGDIVNYLFYRRYNNI